MDIGKIYGKDYQEKFGALDYEPFRLMRTFCRFLIPPMRILIIGAAKPRQIKVFSDRGDTVIAIDISEYAVEKSRELCRRFKNYHVMVGDVRNLDFEDKTFDISFCRYIMEHYDLETNRKILAELARVTKRFIIVGVSTSDVKPDRLNADPTHQTKMTFKAWTKFLKSVPYIEVLSGSKPKEVWILKPKEIREEIDKWL